MRQGHVHSWAWLSVVHDLAGQSCGELGTIPAVAGAECAGVPNHEKGDSGPEKDRQGEPGLGGLVRSSHGPS